MKQFLRLFGIMGLVFFIAFATNCSCGKVPTGTSPNNSGGDNRNNSGGDNGGGGDNTPNPSSIAITISNVAAGKAKVVGDTIYINAMATPNEMAIHHDSAFTHMQATTTTTRTRHFDVVITGGVVGDATGGLVVASYGNKDKFADMEITGTSIGITSQGLHNPMNIAMTTYNDGSGHNPFGGPGNLWEGLGGGVSIFSAFTDNATTPGYSFGTLNPTDPTDANKLKPIFYCSTTLNDVKARVTANVPTTTKLTGGQKSSCWIAAVYNTFVNTATPPALTANGTQWLAAAETATFKKTIEVTFAGIRTDEKTVVNLGLPGATDVAKATAFSNGLTTAEMTALAGANLTAAKKYKISIVGQTAFDALVAP